MPPMGKAVGGRRWPRADPRRGVILRWRVPSAAGATRLDQAEGLLQCLGGVERKWRLEAPTAFPHRGMAAGTVAGIYAGSMGLVTRFAARSHLPVSRTD